MHRGAAALNAESGRTENVDPREAGHFDSLAARWWDPEGDFRTLHDINEPRVTWLADRVTLAGARVLDVGCGGGVLSEALARRGARVAAIDVADRPLEVARLHAMESELEIDYRRITAEALAEAEPEGYDVVCCLEMLEHVPEPQSVVAACARLCRPGGALLFSTINRSPLAWATAIVGAEYVLGLLPKGTHRYDRLIRPAELATACRSEGLNVHEITGMRYNPVSRTVRIGAVPRVNYFLHAGKPEPA
jgi:2-polyprenyl-6-hydroxyphenyl methylase / 3-demethylubiquinone-9 3-methyltransferase